MPRTHPLANADVAVAEETFKTREATWKGFFPLIMSSFLENSIVNGSENEEFKGEPWKRKSTYDLVTWIGSLAKILSILCSKRPEIHQVSYKTVVESREALLLKLEMKKVEHAEWFHSHSISDIYEKSKYYVEDSPSLQEENKNYN